MNWMEGDKPGSTAPGLRGVLSKAGSAKIMAEAHASDTVASLLAQADKGPLHGADRWLKAHAHVVATYRDLVADNVVGTVPGSRSRARERRGALHGAPRPPGHRQARRRRRDLQRGRRQRERLRVAARESPACWRRRIRGRDAR